jgi:ribose transport system substrate-binding protein
MKLSKSDCLSGKYASLLITAFLCFFLTGCNRAPNSSEPQRAAPNHEPKPMRGTVGLSVLTLTNPFFKEIADSMKAELATNQYDLIVVSGELDALRQQNQVKDFIVRKVAAIVLTPCDSKAISSAIKEANAAGIPVFTADIACLDPQAHVVCHVATDNYSGGKEAARALLQAVGGKGNLAILDHPVVESAMLRTKGFEEVIAQADQAGTAKVKIVAKIPGGGAKDVSFNATEDLIQAHPDLAGIFAVNDPSALGARAALEKAGKAVQVKIVGFDGQLEGKQAIKLGKIWGDPVQFPDRIGIETARAVLRHFEGQEVPKQILIPTSLYTKTEADKDTALP